ncbi:amidase [Novosphingobium sp. Fuku2-ISO-50]|uniref:amidase n=1 Tax=Novosphingobium sp. Fuku2-ISO-50 TaxID=1739114 RepID=UPI00076D83EC|nr:amidase [Novosphingobium sp. Fuku2-ISO-50]KUR81292.1 amidase [Novosphingobium sp. Fuku2-ISO-50]
MTQAPLHYRELVEVAALLASRALSAAELMEHVLARVDSLEGGLHAFACIDREGAMRQARRADRMLANGQGGVLEGVPVAVKDLFHTADLPTAAGMPIHRDFRPARDATVVRRLREAGAINFAKTQMTEGAFAIHHPAIAAPVNPWGDALWTGASSSGSGVGVAAGLAFASLGSDTGGSIRFPCAANGLTGLKPSWGRVSRHGAFELAASLDHVGPIARSARDVALLYTLIAGHDPEDPTSWAQSVAGAADQADVRGLVVGVDPHWNSEGCDAAVVRAVDEMQASLVALGAQVREIALPDLTPACRHWELLAGTEAALAHEATYPARAAEYGPALSRLIDGGRAASAMDYQRALADRMVLTGGLDASLGQIDVLLAPVQPYAAPTLERLGELAADPEANARLIAYTSPFNLSGHPTLCLPGRPTDEGAPIGVQLVAARGREDLLLRAGIAVQRETAWHSAHPCLP